MGFSRIITLMLIPAACTTNEASHLPLNPLMLPVHAASSGLSNISYNARRSKVKAHVATHHAGLMSEISTRKTGPLLNTAYTLAHVPVSQQKTLTRRLSDDQALYRGSIDALVVALMVHGQ